MEEIVDPMYPIYSIRINWIEDGEKSAFGKDDSPEGRRVNGTQFNRMFKTDPTQDELDKIVQEYIEAEDKDKIKNISDVNVKIDYQNRESWCIGWFYHWTFDVGQSDLESVQSFERFVERKRRQNMELGVSWDQTYVPESAYDAKSKTDPGKRYYCLMGSEDHWRWRSAEKKKTEDGVEYLPLPVDVQAVRKMDV